jgi:hypothetical protein
MAAASVSQPDAAKLLDCQLRQPAARLAETIWRLLGEGKTQQEVADELEWSRGQVSQYAMLQQIDEKAWQLVATKVRDSGVLPKDEEVANSATTVAFSERLLRVLVPLTAEATALLLISRAVPSVGVTRTLREIMRVADICNGVCDLSRLGAPDAVSG